MQSFALPQGSVGFGSAACKTRPSQVRIFTFARLVLVAITLVIYAKYSETTAATLYWNSRFGGIQRGDLNTGAVEQVIDASVVDDGTGLAIDVAAGFIYWAQTGGPTGGDAKIMRARLDGSEAEVILQSGLEYPTSVLVEPTSGKLYWADLTARSISRANLDGSDPEPIITRDEFLSVGASGPVGLALDPDSGTLYWTARGANVIGRSDLDGNRLEALITGITDDPSEMVFDAASNKIYWTDSGRDLIERANTDGSHLEVVARGNNDLGLTLDAFNREIFWSDRFSNAIHKASLDGLHQTVVFSFSGAMSPQGLVVVGTQVPEPANIGYIALVVIVFSNFVGKGCRAT